MQTGGIGAGSLGFYRDYTAILQKSAHASDTIENLKENTVRTPEIPAAKEAAAPSVQGAPYKEVDLQAASDSLATITDFELIGRDSDVAKLDVGKAISDMKRDSILQDYQYFVGTAI